MAIRKQKNCPSTRQAGMPTTSSITVWATIRLPKTHIRSTSPFLQWMRRRRFSRIGHHGCVHSGPTMRISPVLKCFPPSGYKWGTVLRWGTEHGGTRWGGSCAGMSTAALMKFVDPVRFDSVGATVRTPAFLRESSEFDGYAAEESSYHRCGRVPGADTERDHQRTTELLGREFCSGGCRCGNETNGAPDSGCA